MTAAARLGTFPSAPLLHRLSLLVDLAALLTREVDFDALLGSDPHIALGLLRVLARRFADTDRLLTSDR